MLVRLSSCVTSYWRLRYTRPAARRLCKITAQQRTAVLQFAFLNSSVNQDASLRCLCCLYASPLRAAHRLIDWTLGCRTGAIRSKEEDAWTEIRRTHCYAGDGSRPR